MVVIPSGSFAMGSLIGGGEPNETPQHPVTIPKPFAVSVFQVTVEEWGECVKAKGCTHEQPAAQGLGLGSQPVIEVNWHDAQEYVNWLSKETKKTYRLLSESEWEYVARAGTTTLYFWGDTIDRNKANCRGCGSSWDGKRAAPVDSFEANNFGLHILGNVREWVEDCAFTGYDGAPKDGTARQGINGKCDAHIVRGGSWDSSPKDLRVAARGDAPLTDRASYTGFRVARTLDDH